MLKKRDSCRLCDNDQLALALKLKATPIADAFHAEKLNKKFETLYPLDIFRCLNCGHFQHLEFIEAVELFDEYIFRTSSSKGLVNHFKSYAKNCVESFGLRENNLVVEIGSNDGTLLKFFEKYKLRVIGIDPAKSIASDATSEGINTIVGYFSDELAAKIRNRYGQASLICANNVFAHADNLISITKGIKNLLEPSGIFIFEVSYIVDMIKNCVFDTIYHEHLSYHSIKPLKIFFSEYQLHIFNVEKINTKGGSIRVYVQHSGGPYIEKDIVQDLIQKEESQKLYSHNSLQNLNDGISASRHATLSWLENNCGRKTVYGFGASPTCTTILYQLQLEKQITNILDDNEDKQNLFSPGENIEVISPKIIQSDSNSKIVVILAWQYAEAIINNNINFLKQGGVFLVPMPKFKAFGENFEKWL